VSDALAPAPPLSRRADSVRGSAIRELLRLSERHDVISFGGGLPASEALPVDAIAEATARVLASAGAAALQYTATEGIRPLRELIAERVRRRGVPATPEEVLVTSGAQQGLDLIGRLFLDPGVALVTEAPTFLGALQAFSAYEPRILAAAIDERGVRLDLLEDRLRRRPRFLYVLPNFQNPSGVSLAPTRRPALMELAARHDVLVVEDDPYHELYYEGEPLRPLAALDPPRVVQLGSFSKILAPGLRVGWMVGPRPLIRKLALLKQGADLHTGTLAQHIVVEACRDGLLERHLPRLRAVHRERRDAMLEALARYFPTSARWTRPQGGLFLWVTLPVGCDSETLLRAALAKDVAFVPGASFFPDGSGRNSFRLNFSYTPPSAIIEGVRRLGKVLHATLRHAS
jgi:2-aminoadipate transaminase